MRPLLKLPLTPATMATATASAPEVTGLVERRKQAVRAIEQTKATIQSGRLAGSGDAVAKDLETALAGKPEPGEAGVVRTRVVATAVAREKLPAVPLGGLQVRLKVKAQIVREDATNDAGIVDLEVPAELTKSDYELEVLAPDCTVVACQHGRLSTKQPSPVHLFALPRLQSLKPQIERAQPIEDGLKAARERATLVRKVAVKALKEQQTRLVAYLAEIDEALTSVPPCESTPPQRAAKEDAVRTPPPKETAPAKTAPSPASTLKKKTKTVKSALAKSLKTSLGLRRRVDRKKPTT